MKLTIRYAATYQYEGTVGLSPHVARLFPRQELFLRIRKFDFKTSENATIHYGRDIFDNLYASCFFPDEVNRMQISLELGIEISERNPFHFLLEAHALEAPFKYQAAEHSVLKPYMEPPKDFEIPDALRWTTPLPTVDALTLLNQWLHKNIKYERREQGESRSPEETLRLGSGACRDTSVLLAAILRAQGLATRLVSGYLWESDSGRRTADNALHAWVETYLPGAGWVGLDPTNGIFCDHHFIPAAMGIESSHIAPIVGTYFSPENCAGKLAVKLEILPQ